VPVDEWRKLRRAAKPTLKELLLADEARADIPVPTRRRRHRRELPLD
jgi:antitoxin Phd